jgi:hypothetical protein
MLSRRIEDFPSDGLAVAVRKSREKILHRNNAKVQIFSSSPRVSIPLPLGSSALLVIESLSSIHIRGNPHRFDSDSVQLAKLDGSPRE